VLVDPLPFSALRPLPLPRQSHRPAVASPCVWQRPARTRQVQRQRLQRAIVSAVVSLSQKHSGEPRPVLWRQPEQRGRERGPGVRLLAFRLAGATAGATGFGAWRIYLMGYRVALLFRLNGIQEVAGSNPASSTPEGSP